MEEERTWTYQLNSAQILMVTSTARARHTVDNEFRMWAWTDRLGSK